LCKEINSRYFYGSCCGINLRSRILSSFFDGVDLKKDGETDFRSISIFFCLCFVMDLREDCQPRK
jgi:hypothetical protein